MCVAVTLFSRLFCPQCFSSSPTGRQQPRYPSFHLLWEHAFVVIYCHQSRSDNDYEENDDGDDEDDYDKACDCEDSDVDQTFFDESDDSDDADAQAAVNPKETPAELPPFDQPSATLNSLNVIDSV